jgi:hypothetical protein
MDENKKANWLYGILVMLGLGGIGTTAVLTQTAKTSAPSTSALATTITSTTPVPLTFELGSNLVDWCVKSIPRVTENDLTDAATISMGKALGFSCFAMHGVGQIAQNTHWSAITGKGSGYNFHASDWSSPTEEAAWGGGIGVAPWKDDFATMLIAYVNAMGNSRIDLVFNTQNGTWAENSAMLKQCPAAKYIWLNAEGVTDDGYNVSQYIKDATASIDSTNKYFPGKKFIIDLGLIYRKNPGTVDWNTQLYAAFKSKSGVVGGRIYHQAGDRDNYTANQDSNVMRVHTFWFTTVPQDMRDFQASFPGWQSFCGEELSIDNRAGSTRWMDRKMGDVIFWYEAIMFHLDNQSIEPLALQMSFKNMMTNGTDYPEYIAVKRLNEFLRTQGANVTSVTFSNMPGVYGRSINSTSGTKMIIVNESKTDYTSSLTVDGKVKTPSITMKRQYAKDFDSNVSADSIVTSTLVIPACSGGVYSFK